MPKRNTKELILQESLKLFSTYGYQGVSVRDIARVIGICESGLYKHFKSKQDIFNSLMVRMDELYQESSVAFELPQGDISFIAAQYAQNDLQFLKQISTSLFLFWLKDDFASKFRRMLTIEQFNNSEAGNAFKAYFFESVLSFQALIFEELIRIGYFRSADPQIMALHFYAPIFLLFNQYDNKPEKELEVLKILEKHLEQFALLYTVEQINKKACNQLTPKE